MTRAAPDLPLPRTVSRDCAANRHKSPRKLRFAPVIIGLPHVEYGLIWIDIFPGASDYSAWRWEGALSTILLASRACYLPAPLANERIITMSDATLVLDQAEEAILSFQVSDEALETAAGSVKENAFTLGSCTGYSVCPMTAPV